MIVLLKQSDNKPECVSVWHEHCVRPTAVTITLSVDKQLTATIQLVKHTLSHPFEPRGTLYLEQVIHAPTPTSLAEQENRSKSCFMLQHLFIYLFINFICEKTVCNSVCLSA